jgi:histone H3/H4
MALSQSAEIVHAQVALLLDDGCSESESESPDLVPEVIPLETLPVQEEEEEELWCPGREVLVPVEVPEKRKRKRTSPERTTKVRSEEEEEEEELTPDDCFNRRTFKKLVHTISASVQQNKETGWESEAIDNLMLASFQYMRAIFNNGSKCAMFRERVTLMPKDLHLAASLEFQW